MELFTLAMVLQLRVMSEQLPMESAWARDLLDYSSARGKTNQVPVQNTRSWSDWLVAHLRCIAAHEP